MTDETTGLPADNIDASLDPATRSGYTSPTNIGAYLWSTVSAEELGIIGKREAKQRLKQTLTTLATMERHEPSGMFYNWYDEATGAKLTVFPTGETVYPFLSTVDNGWFAAALMVVRTAEPSLRKQVDVLLEPMNFAAFYDANQFGGTRPGMMRGGFWADPPAVRDRPRARSTGSPVYFTKNHYDITNSEPRIASYIGIARGQIPPEHYFATNRTFPASCDWSWLEQRPVGVTRTYEGIDVFEGAFTYRGMHIVPTWGGDMFEELMPDLFVPESDVGARRAGASTTRSPSARTSSTVWTRPATATGASPPPATRSRSYNVYGVDAIGMNPDGLPVRRGEDQRRRGLRRLPPGDQPDADVRRRRRDPARLVPRAAVRTARGRRQPAQHRDHARRVRRRRVLRLGRGPLEHAGRSATCRSTRAWSWARWATCSATTCCTARSARRDVERVLRPLIGQEEFSAGVIK